MKRTSALKFLERRAPTILTLCGGAGVIFTTALAIKETPRAIDRIKKLEEEKGAELTKLEVAVNVAPIYIPTITSGLCTIICIFSANALNQKKQASLVAAYNMLFNYHNNYRNTLIDIYGQEADTKVKTELARRRCDMHFTDIDTPDDKCVWVEDYTGDSVIAYERSIMDAEYHLNRNFSMRGYATLNEWLEFLGLPLVEEGDDIGWSKYDGIEWIDFEHYPVEHSSDDSGPSICCISALFPPELLEED